MWKSQWLALAFVLSLIKAIMYFIKAQSEMTLLHHLTSNVSSLFSTTPDVKIWFKKWLKYLPKLVTNDREQYKDNNNNDSTIKYLQPNNHNLLDLAKKHYENLVETFTNNAINDSSFSSNTIPVELPVTTATSHCGIWIFF